MVFVVQNIYFEECNFGNRKLCIFIPRLYWSPLIKFIVKSIINVKKMSIIPLYYESI